MIQFIELKLLPEEAALEQVIKDKTAAKLGVPSATLNDCRVVRRSIDARGAQPFFLLRVEAYIKELYQPEPLIIKGLHPVDGSKKVIIVGAGPAGYFAALELLEQGIQPIIFDRGKDVRARRRDLRAIQQFGIVHPHSNYCFGEGGAGTYSDGKLYTRSHKRGDIDKVLKLLVEHGASKDILIDAHPHIGSNKLPNIVANIRETILHYGGKIHFNSHVTDFIIQQERMLGVVVNDATEHIADAVLLATGHSARDIYHALHRHHILIEAKPFALGVRIEHSQALIDQIQYRQSPRNPHLPASSYKLVCQIEDRGVFSFCMCPGGLVVPAAIAPGEIVVNGMSMSRRDSAYANSGVVVAVETTDFQHLREYGVFAGLAFQQQIERAMFAFGDGSQRAPAQRLTDFVQGKISASLPDSSYIPGLVAAPLHKLLPKPIARRLRFGVQEFGKKMRGYYTEEANVIGTESRTSAPIRIPRDRDTYMHPHVKGLFPCGEGAGYAGGIVSAAMDGQNVARAIAKHIYNM
ncbi:MAG TPA: FAD-dependent monooxygenase [Saprospiraceae bacterium]|nr:FAD-dependent monooxygenase [Saprospiraceae bacterium]